MPDGDIVVTFKHGLGDCSNFVHLLQLYKRRHFGFNVRSDHTKTLLWQAAGGQKSTRGDRLTHEWLHPPRFNDQACDAIAHCNKVAWNINRAPLPMIGDQGHLWDELCGVRLESSLTEFIMREIRQVERLTHNLSQPLILLHTTGATSRESKSIPKEIAVELCRLLLNVTSGTLVLLDWDASAPEISHSRILRTGRHWGHLNLSQLAALMHKAALLIAVDSGPYHFGGLTPIPVLGVFYDHLPWCVALPRPKTVNMTRSSLRRANVLHRCNWNLVEYSTEKPTAQEIAFQAQRILDGPRYGLPLGRDIMLQQWVRDWSASSTPRFPVIDRNNSMDFILREVRRRYSHPTIVETGCIRTFEDWSAGYSTYVFGAFLHGLTQGKLFSIDNDRERADFARNQTLDWRDRLEIVCSDSVAWLSGFTEQIDLLYLDSLDTDYPEHADHALRETSAAIDKLSPSALIAFDDSLWDGRWLGKGAKAIPYLLGLGWRVLRSGYQTVLSRTGE